MTTTAEATVSRDIAHDAGVLVRDLHGLKAGIYWTDLLISLTLGWGAFAAALTLRLPASAAAAAVSVFALYRALCFIHEISHRSRRSLPGFEFIWNLTTGFPLLLPSCMYVGVHANHHGLSTYGTNNDPEYLPFARSARMALVFAGQSLLLPLALWVRFVLLAPAAFFIPSLERWLVAHFSSLSMNARYRRDVTPGTLRMIRGHSAAILILWAGIATFAPVRFYFCWYIVSAGISLINSLRTLGAHAYRSPGHALTRDEQFEDSIDTPAARWGALWAPVGLRFHALHHYFPGIPYHNLGKAHGRLVSQLPLEAGIHRVRSRGLAHSLRTLWRAGSGKAGSGKKD